MKNKKILVPLYIADAIMFFAVFAMAIPSFINGEPLDFNLATLLCALVFLAMLLMFLPIYLQFLLEKDSVKKEGDEKFSKITTQIKSIYSDLRTLRDSLISQIETSETLRGDLDVLTSDFESAQSKLDSIQNALTEIKETFDSKNLDAEKLAEKVQGMEDSAISFSSDFDDFKLDSQARLESVLSEFSALKQQFENFYSAINSLGADSGEDEQSASDVSDEVSQNPQNLDEEKSVEEDNNTAESEEEFTESDSAKNAESEPENIEPLEENPELHSEIDSEIFEDEDAFVDDKIDAGESKSSSEDASEITDDGEPSSEENIETFKTQEMEDIELGAENGKESEALTESEIAPNSDADKKIAWSGMIEKALSNSQSDDTKSAVSKFIERSNVPSTSEQKDENKESFASANDELFSELEMSKNPDVKEAKSGQTAVIVNSFIGLGNEPYIRGTGMGLSLDKGVALKMLEIGKWQWVCDGLPTSPIKFTIWLNDKTPSSLGEIELNPAEIKIIDVKF